MQDFTNDLGRNSYNISKIKKAFEYAYQLLSTGSNYFVKKRPVSILEKLVRRDTVLAKRDKVISHLEIPVSNKSPKSSKQKNKPEEKRCKLLKNPLLFSYFSLSIFLNSLCGYNK